MATPGEDAVGPGKGRMIELSEQAQINELRKQAQMAFEFAKFGFAGTLSGAFGGMVLVLALALLQAFTSFKMETYGYVGITGFIAICVVAYGFFSHKMAPVITVKSGDKPVTIGPSYAESGDKPITIGPAIGGDRRRRGTSRLRSAQRSVEGAGGHRDAGAT